MDSKFNISQPYVLATKKANGILVFTGPTGIANKQKKVGAFSLLSTGEATPGELCSVLDPSVHERHGKYWEESNRGPSS